MILIDAMKDFFGGLAKGVGLFLRERNHFATDMVAPGLTKVKR